MNELNRPQLDRHAANWNIPRTARKVVRWSDVHNWVERELAEESSGSITSFLLTQFLAFLDLTELAPFRGFRDEDFDFFNSPVPELRPIVKNRLAGLGEKVFALLTDSEREAIGEVHVGQIGEGADHAWLDTQHRQDVVNLTIELYEHELQVNLVGWRRDQARQFERWLLSDDALLRLPKLVSHDFVVYERSAYNIGRKGTGARPWWQKEHIEKVAWRPAPQISRAWIEEMLGEFDDRSWRKPGFHIRRSFREVRLWPQGRLWSARSQRRSERFFLCSSTSTQADQTGPRRKGTGVDLAVTPPQRAARPDRRAAPESRSCCGRARIATRRADRRRSPHSPSAPPPAP